MEPYYEDDAVTIYHGDCREIVPSVAFDAMVTDPPYPNNAGHFLEGISVARSILASARVPTITFWTELEHPPHALRLAAVHIWHRSNVNGRPYEPAYEFGTDHKRSNVYRHPAIFDGAGPGCNEYLGHPTQKPVALMRQLIDLLDGSLLDPFMGSGSTLRAAKDMGRKAIGIELSERYCEIAARRMAQEVLAL